MRRPSPVLPAPSAFPGWVLTEPVSVQCVLRDRLALGVTMEGGSVCLPLSAQQVVAQKECVSALMRGRVCAAFTSLFPCQWRVTSILIRPVQRPGRV